MQTISLILNVSDYLPVDMAIPEDLNRLISSSLSIMIQNNNTNMAANNRQKLHKPLYVTSKKYKIPRKHDKSLNSFHSTW